MHSVPSKNILCLTLNNLLAALTVDISSEVEKFLGN